VDLKERFITLSVFTDDPVWLVVVGFFSLFVFSCPYLVVFCFFLFFFLTPLNWCKLCWSHMKLIRYVYNNDNLSFLYFRIQQE